MGMVAAGIAVIATLWFFGEHEPTSAAPSPESAPSLRSKQPDAATDHAPEPVTPARLERAASSVEPGLESAAFVAGLAPGILRSTLLLLPPETRNQAVAKIERLKIPVEDQASLRVSPTGKLYYVCDLQPPSPTQSVMKREALAPDAIPPGPVGKQSAAVQAPALAAAVPVTSPPIRHSRPGATRVLYLDFNGETITGTDWNISRGVATYEALPYNNEGDAATFSDAEQAEIIAIWARVAEDFSAFDVNVTTEEPAEFTRTTGRALITRNTDANAVALPSSGSGGVAYLGVFGEADYATASSPAFVYYNNFYGNAANVAEAVSHELGHNLGLSHDGQTGVEYYNGHGSGDTSWGPVMGTGYGRNVSQWTKGEYHAANNPQDDLTLLAELLVLRADEAGDNAAGAIAAAQTSATSLVINGVLTGATDADTFGFRTGATTLNIAATNYRATSGTHGGNADLKLELLNAAGTVVASSDPTATTSASVSYAATAGVYYARVSSAATGNPYEPVAESRTGYTVYGSVGQYTLSGAIVSAASAVIGPLSASVGAGAPFSYFIQATNLPTGYSATNLPAGLVLNPLTGEISGRATIAGVFNVTLGAENQQGGGTASLTLTIADAAPVITGQTSGRQAVSLGGSTHLTVTALSGNGAPTYGWKRNGRVVAGATDSTLTLADATMAMTGWYQALVTNSIGTTVSAPIFVQVVPASTTVLGWGANAKGQITPPGGLTDVVALAAGTDHALALKADGTVVAWGGNELGQAAVPEGLQDVVAIDAGLNYSLALRADGSLVGWGEEAYGQLDFPSNLTGVVAIAAGSYHALALQADGTVMGWGSNGSGQRTIPVGLAEVEAVAAGPLTSVALKTDGTVVAWGYNGNGETNVPGGLTEVTAISAGGFHSVAVRNNGTVANWGFGPYGAAPGGFNTGLKASAGERHTVVLKTDGTVAAWPAGATSGQALVPGGLVQVIDVAGGGDFSLALVNLGKLAQSITFAALADRVFTATPITLSASASSGLTVAFAVLSGPATISGDQLTLTGAGTVTVSATQAGDASYDPAPAVDRSFIVTANYDSWRLEHFTGPELADANLSGPNAVYGQDGLPNLVKYALGLNPKVNATSGLPEVTTAATDWVYTYVRPAERADLNFEVEVSTNLTTWTTVGVTHTRTVVGSTETWQATYPLGAATNCYFRLRVTRL
jgi:hypothetical protein